MFSTIRHLLKHRLRGPRTDDTRILLPQCDIGKETYGNPEVLAWGSTSTLRIGSYCSIGGGVRILLGGNHRTDWVTTFPFPARWPEAAAIAGHPSSNGDVLIEHDVWIARHAVILSGVTIHTGAVIGCNSVVGRDVPPYTIVAGNPARPIRKRFSEERIARLLACKWWELDRKYIVTLLPLFCSDDIDAFCEAVEKIAGGKNG